MTTQKQNKVAVLVLLVGILLGWAAYESKAGASQVPREECAAAIASLTNPSLMSRGTAIRKSRALCIQLQSQDRQLFKAITQ